MPLKTKQARNLKASTFTRMEQQHHPTTEVFDSWFLNGAGFDALVDVITSPSLKSLPALLAILWK